VKTHNERKSKKLLDSQSNQIKPNKSNQTSKLYLSFFCASSLFLLGLSLDNNIYSKVVCVCRKKSKYFCCGAAAVVVVVVVVCECLYSDIPSIFFSFSFSFFMMMEVTSKMSDVEVEAVESGEKKGVSFAEPEQPAERQTKRGRVLPRRTNSRKFRRATPMVKPVTQLSSSFSHMNEIGRNP